MTKTTKTRTTTAIAGNRTQEKTSDSSRPILPEESDGFVSRLEEVIGDESVSSFSRRSQIGESVIRGYLTLGKRPRLDHLVSLSDAGGVLVDWLATGRLPKTRAEMKALQDKARRRTLTRSEPDQDQPLLVKAMIAAEQALGRDAGIEARATLAAKLLETLSRMDKRVGDAEMLLCAEDFVPIAEFLILLERLDNTMNGDS